MASLRDLATDDKAKVAGLLAQVVKQERVCQQLAAALEAERAAATAQVEALREQNREVALENTRCGGLAASPFISQLCQHRLPLPPTSCPHTPPNQPSRQAHTCFWLAAYLPAQGARVRCNTGGHRGQQLHQIAAHHTRLLLLARGLYRGR